MLPPILPAVAPENPMPPIPAATAPGNVMPPIPAATAPGNVMPPIPAATAPGNVMPSIPAATAPGNVMPPILNATVPESPMAGYPFPLQPLPPAVATQADIAAAREYVVQQTGDFARIHGMGWGIAPAVIWNGGYGRPYPDYDIVMYQRVYEPGNYTEIDNSIGFFPDAVQHLASHDPLAGYFSVGGHVIIGPARFRPTSKIKSLDLYSAYWYGNWALGTEPHPLRMLADDLLVLAAQGSQIDLYGCNSWSFSVITTPPGWDWTVNGDPNVVFAMPGEEMMNIGLELQAAGINLNDSWMTPFVDFSEWMTDVDFVAANPNMFTLCEDVGGGVFQPSPTGTVPCTNNSSVWVSIIGDYLNEPLSLGGLNVPEKFPFLYSFGTASDFPYTTASGTIMVIFRADGNPVFKLA